MDRALLGDFYAIRETLEDLDHLAATITFGAAPVLAGVKPAALLSFTRGGRDLHGLWARFEREISALLPLQYCELIQEAARTLILFYRRDALEKWLANPGVAAFLADMGYETVAPPSDVLQVLQDRFAAMFPHEIGVFLGIPVADVKGFIAHQGRDCLYRGYWKVYHDPARAGEIFRAYDRAKSAAAAALLGR